MKVHGLVRDDFPETIEVKPGYGMFFEGIMQIVCSREIDSDLGEKLRQYVDGFLELYNPEDFREYSDISYKRIYLGRDESGWEAVFMCWKKGNQTSVHGHPQFAAYNFAEGKFLIETFREKDDRATLINSIEAGSGQGFFAIGNAGVFDNHIHRITCLSDFGHSLHVYSDDARKGKKYIYNQI